MREHGLKLEKLIGSLDEPKRELTDFVNQIDLHSFRDLEAVDFAVYLSA